MIKKIIFFYYGLSFVSSLSMAFFFPIYTLYLQAGGLNRWEINLVNACFMAGCFLLEIPTGTVADRYGRKISLIISFFTTAVACLFYFRARSMAMFVLAELVAALGVTLSSGAYTSWMVDSLRCYTADADYGTIFARGHLLEQSGSLIGVIIGGYIGAINMSLNWLVSAVCSIVVAVVVWLWAPDPHQVTAGKNQGAWSAFVNIAKDSIGFGLKKRAVFYVVLVNMIFYFSCMAVNMYWPLRFVALGARISSLGWLMAGVYLAVALGAQLSIKLQYLLPRAKSRLLFSMFLFAIGLGLAGVFNNIFSVLPLFYLHELSRGIFKPNKQAYINKRIPTDKRATVISFMEMMGGLGGFFGLLVSGAVAQVYSVGFSWLVSALSMLVGITFLLYYKNGE